VGLQYYNQSCDLEMVGGIARFVDRKGWVLRDVSVTWKLMRAIHMTETMKEPRAAVPS
jgi:hypothetical protein